MKVERGVAHKGNEVELVGMGDQFKTTLTGIGKSLCFRYMRQLFTIDVQKCSTRSWTVYVSTCRYELSVNSF